jgi:hypothetical protein
MAAGLLLQTEIAFWNFVSSSARLPIGLGPPVIWPLGSEAAPMPSGDGNGVMSAILLEDVQVGISHPKEAVVGLRKGYASKSSSAWQCKPAKDTSGVRYNTATQRPPRPLQQPPMSSDCPTLRLHLNIKTVINFGIFSLRPERRLMRWIAYRGRGNGAPRRTLDPMFSKVSRMTFPSLRKVMAPLKLRSIVSSSGVSRGFFPACPDRQCASIVNIADLVAN